MIQVVSIQSYLNLKIGLPSVLKAGSSGTCHVIKVIYTLPNNGKNSTLYWMLIAKLPKIVFRAFT